MPFVASGGQGAADKAADCTGIGVYTWAIDNAVSRVLGVAQQNMHRSVRS